MFLISYEGKINYYMKLLKRITLNKLQRFVLFFWLIILNNDAVGQIRLTLQEAIDSAVTRNPSVRQAELSRDLDRENLTQSRNNRLPAINANPQFSSNWGRSLDLSTYSFITQRVSLISGSIGMQLNLYQGGSIRNQILQNKFILEASESNVSKVKNDLTLETLTVFFQVVTDQHLLEVSRQQVVLAEHNLKMEKIGFDAGNKSIANLAQAKAQLAVATLDETTIQSRLKISMERLKELMALQTANLVVVEPDSMILENSFDTKDSSRILNQALKFNSDLKVLFFQAQAALQGVKVAKSSLLPSLTLFSSIGSNFSDARSLVTGTQQVGFDTVGRVLSTNQPVLSPSLRTISKNYSFIRQFSDNFYQSIGLTMQIPIFNRFTNKTNIKKAALSYQLAKSAIDEKNNSLIRIINQAISDIKTSANRLEAAKSVYEANQEVLRVSKKRYEANLINALEFNTAIGSFNRAQFDQIEAKYAMLFRIKILDFYTGNLSK